MRETLVQKSRPKLINELSGQKLAKDCLKAIVKNPDDAPRVIILYGERGVGKAQPKDTIIPTPCGDRRFGDLQVGDYVFGSNGKSTKVLGVYNRGLMNVYRVHFSDGSYLDVGKDHLWTIRATRSHCDRYDIKYLENTIDTETILKYLNSNNIKLFDKATIGKPYIQLTEPLEYKEVIEPLCDPYILGALIADGYLASTKHNLAWTKKEQSVINEMSKRCIIHKNSGNNYCYRLNKNENESVWNALTYYELFGKKSREKFIPKELFQMSIENRKLLLQGLMDGDGSLSHSNRPSNYIVKYGTTSEQLANDIIRLITSLGSTARKFYKPSDKCWYIRFNADFNPFLASNFKDRFKITDNKGYANNKRYFDKIEVLEPQEMQCILVEAKDHLYIGDNQFNIVTHNTSLARAFARALNCNNPIDNDACGVCDNCRANIDSVPYYEEYDSSVIGNVETIRQLRDYFDYNSDEGYKVITIDEAHLISKQAQSALLKVFEDVSTKVFFILCTTDKDALLKTIQSRAFTIGLEKLSFDDIVKNLKETAIKNNITIDDNIINDIARKSRGHMRDAHMMLQSYSILDEDTFNESTSSARDILLIFLIACYKKEKDIIPKCINKLFRFPLSNIKVDYEYTILEIMKYSCGMLEEERKDKLLVGLGSLVRNKALDLYYILNDPVIYNSFVSDYKLQAALYVIYEKINGNIR